MIKGIKKIGKKGDWCSCYKALCFQTSRAKGQWLYNSSMEEERRADEEEMELGGVSIIVN